MSPPSPLSPSERADFSRELALIRGFVRWHPGWRTYRLFEKWTITMLRHDHNCISRFTSTAVSCGSSAKPWVKRAQARLTYPCHAKVSQMNGNVQQVIYFERIQVRFRKTVH